MNSTRVRPMASMLANRTSQAAVALAYALTTFGISLMGVAIALTVLDRTSVTLYVTAAIVLVLGILAVLGATRFRNAHTRALAEYEQAGGALPL